jgi:hypothetical protein
MTRAVKQTLTTAATQMKLRLRLGCQLPASAHAHLLQARGKARITLQASALALLPSTTLIFFCSTDPLNKSHIHGPCLFGRRDEKGTIKTSRQIVHSSIGYRRTLGHDASSTTFQDRQRSPTMTTGLHAI